MNIEKKEKYFIHRINVKKILSYNGFPLHRRYLLASAFKMDMTIHETTTANVLRNDMRVPKKNDDEASSTRKKTK